MNSSHLSYLFQLENYETNSKKHVNNFIETFYNPHAALPLANGCGWMPVVAEVYDKSSCLTWFLYFCESLITGLQYIIFIWYFCSCTNQKQSILSIEWNRKAWAVNEEPHSKDLVHVLWRPRLHHLHTHRKLVWAPVNSYFICLSLESWSSVHFLVVPCFTARPSFI